MFTGSQNNSVQFPRSLPHRTIRYSFLAHYLTEQFGTVSSLTTSQNNSVQFPRPLPHRTIRYSFLSHYLTEQFGTVSSLTTSQNNSVQFPRSLPEVFIVFGLCILEEPVACAISQVIAFSQPTPIASSPLTLSVSVL